MVSFFQDLKLNSPCNVTRSLKNSFMHVFVFRLQLKPSTMCDLSDLKPQTYGHLLAVIYYSYKNIIVIEIAIRNIK